MWRLERYKLKFCTSIYFSAVFALLSFAESDVAIYDVRRLQSPERTVIEGVGFGRHGPNIHLFERFEKGENSEKVDTGAGSCEIGGWHRREGDFYYSNQTCVSGSLAAQADMSSGYRNLLEAKFDENGTRQLFISWWQYLPENNYFPGEKNSNGINWKMIWIMGENTTDDDLAIPAMVGKEILIDGNDDCLTSVRPNKIPSTTNRQWLFKKGKWHHLWAYISADHEKKGQLTLHELSSLGMLAIDERKNIRVFCDPKSIFERVYINGYGRQTPDSKPFFDDIYIATGEHARARVLVGNSPLYTQCTDFAVGVVKNWTDTSIVADLYRFPQSKKNLSYIFVITSKGRISSGMVLPETK